MYITGGKKDGKKYKELMYPRFYTFLQESAAYLLKGLALTPRTPLSTLGIDHSCFMPVSCYSK